MGTPQTPLCHGALLGASALLALGLVACNEHPVSLTQASGDVETVVTQGLGGNQLDILWMIDNSGSMCRSQSILRDGIDEFVDILDGGELDFHIAVTTSHLLDCDELDPEEQPLRYFQACVYEPVASAGRLQATPQPIPGPDDRCYHPIDQNAEPIIDEFDPIIESVETSVSCTENPGDYEHLLNFDDPEWERHLRCTGEIDNPLDPSDCTGDEDFEDLFPASSDYRDIDLVLRSEDYILTADDVADRPDLSDDDVGSLDTERFRQDFSCMSLVGTRGSGYEQGLAAATLALSPELTGGADTTPDQRDEFPNAGFLRSDAQTSVIFVSDENDCSVDDDFNYLSPCDVNECSIQENRLRQGLESSMFPIESLYTDFVINILGNKRPELAEQFNEIAQDNDSIDHIDDLAFDDPLRLEIEGYTSSILPASIHGAFQDLDESAAILGDDIPLECPEAEDSSQGSPWEVPTSCLTPFGRAWSGHRYAFFLQKFPQFFPFDEEEGAPIGGEICSDFAPVMRELADFILAEATGCVTDVYPCQGLSDTGCPNHRYSGEPGSCVPYRTNVLVTPVLSTLNAADIDGVDAAQLDAFIDLASQDGIAVENAVSNPDLGLDLDAQNALLDAIDQRIAEDEDAAFYCDTGLEARLSAADNDSLTLEDLEATGYCIDEDSSDPSLPESCVINPERFLWATCEGNGLRVNWNDTEADQIIGDFDLLIRYASTRTAGGESSAQSDANNQDDGNNQDDVDNQNDD